MTSLADIQKTPLARVSNHQVMDVVRRIVASDAAKSTVPVAAFQSSI